VAQDGMTSADGLTSGGGLGSDAGFRFDNSYMRDLPGAFLALAPDTAPSPQIVILNRDLAADLGLDGDVLAAHPAWFAGGDVPTGAQPLSMAYAGHQFGGFSPQLGDGRAHLLGEHIGPDGHRWDIHLKGSGRTPFSRGGDGKAALGPMLREYLISEAMAAMAVPTTRALAVTLTGEDVWRDTGRLPGAVVTRVAASHLRVGTFQFFSARGETEKLRTLTDYAIARHDPDLVDDPGRCLAFFDRVVARQVALVAAWMGVGFVHGVMNTDNVAISGETIDYGPCAFLDNYALGTVFSSIDRQGRYAYGNQPAIIGWNVARLAETLLPLIPGAPEAAVDALNARLGAIADDFRAAHLAVMRRKLGMTGTDPHDGTLIDDLLAAMVGSDWTLTFRRLAGDGAGLVPEVSALLPRLVARGMDTALMRATNPIVIPRNHLVEEALTAATAGDIAPFNALLAVVQRPYDAPAKDRYTLPPPAGFGDYVTFCGT
jgi:uncharacterized protein YdiU (UPF0061 family)